MTDTRPIGVFDSGVGGLTVLRAIHDILPGESTIYVGDLAYFPYGPQPLSEVRERARALVEYFSRRDVKALVVACNTATAASIDGVEEWFSGPVVGVVRPGAEEAVDRSSGGRIGVLATEGVVRSLAYSRAILRVCPECEVVQTPLGSLVALVESGAVDSAEARAVVEEAIFGLLDENNCDTIVLGCTHFPLARDLFDRTNAGRAVIVDSAGSTARRLEQVLTESGLLAPSSKPTHEFLATAHADSFVALARQLFGANVEASVVPIEYSGLSVSSART